MGVMTDPTTGEYVADHETRDSDGEVSRTTEWFATREEAERYSTEGPTEEGPIETSAVGLPMNAYTMGYYAGLYGLEPEKGLAGSSRYIKGYLAGQERWLHYLRIARGEE